MLFSVFVGFFLVWALFFCACVLAFCVRADFMSCARLLVFTAFYVPVVVVLSNKVVGAFLEFPT